MKAKLTNQTNSPFDIQTLNGPAVLHAFSTLEGDFDPAFLELLKAGRAVLVEDGGAPAAEPAVNESLAVEVTQPVVQDAGEPVVYDPYTEYRTLAGKDADGRWSATRLAAEIAKLKEA